MLIFRGEYRKKFFRSRESNGDIFDNILVNEDSDLLFRTSLNRNGRLIKFTAGDGYTGFTGTIIVYFPPYCVLGSERIFLEVIPRAVVQNYNDFLEEQNYSSFVITPIIHIDRNNDVPFLRDVGIILPVFKDFTRTEKTSLKDVQILDEDHLILTESKFSPIGASYDRIKNILKAFRVDTHFSLSFRDSGVYLLFEQLPDRNAVFDIRRFEDEEEHRLYRMDEKKAFRMIVNPQHIKPDVYNTELILTFEGIIIHLVLFLP